MVTRSPTTGAMRVAMPFCPLCPPGPKHRPWCTGSVCTGENGPMISSRDISQRTGAAWGPREPSSQISTVALRKPLPHPEAGRQGAWPVIPQVCLSAHLFKKKNRVLLSALRTVLIVLNSPLEQRFSNFTVHIKHPGDLVGCGS